MAVPAKADMSVCFIVLSSKERLGKFMFSTILKKNSHSAAAEKPLSTGQRWRRRAPYLAAFFIPVFCMICIFIGKEIYPFGDRSFLRTDLYHQYAPFFQEMKDKLSSGENLFYSWDIGLGTNFMAIYAYYLSSPMNWLLLLCPRTHVIEFITYGIVLKMALSSLTMTIYLNKHNKRNSIIAAFFGVFYGMSGYMAAYSWNIMWLDCMVLLPIIILGLERLVKEDKCFLYCITLGLAILSNYYISIMICISLVIYFIASLIMLKGKNINYPLKVLNFAIFSLLAGGLAAAVLLPEIAALSYTASGKFNFPTDWTSYFSTYDMIARHMMNTKVEIGLDHWPNIYCGVAVFIFFPFFIMNNRVSLREKVVYISLLIFFYLSFSTNTLNFIWHGFHYPNSLPARQSFIYIFLLLSACFRGFTGVRKFTSRQLIGCVSGAVLFIILAEKLEASYVGSGDDMYYMWFSFYASILFVIIYGILVMIYNKHSRKVLNLVLTILAGFAVTVEATVNMSYTSVTTVSRTTYMEYDENVRSMVSEVAQDEDSGFYRIEKIRNRTKNDGAWLDYPSASIFSSTAYADLTAFYKKIGLESSTNAYGTKGTTLASSMLLGIRYTIYTNNDSEPDDDEFRTKVSTTDNASLYRNTYTLPLGFVVSSTLETDWQPTYDDPALNWNELTSALGIEDPLFIPIEVTDNNTTTVSVTTDEDGYIVLYSSKTGPDEVSVTYDGTSKTFENLGRNYFMSMDYQMANTIFTIKNNDASSTKVINLSAYRMDTDVLKELYDKLNESPMEVSSYSESSVSATVNASSSGTLVTTIPYDTGWSVKVDGKSVEISEFEDAFISFPVSIGSHTIEMKYVPDGFNLGLAITAISIILLAMIWAIIRLWKKNQAALEQSAELEAGAADNSDAEMVSSNDTDILANDKIETIQADESAGKEVDE